MSNFKGSEWNKWDLHIHTPLSIINQYADNNQKTDDKDVWDKYVDELEKLPNDVKVIGINDYYFLDGYEKLIKEYKWNGRLTNIEKIFLLLEFRIDTFVPTGRAFSKINLHLLFDIDETNKDEFDSKINEIKEKFNIKLDISSVHKCKDKSLTLENFINLSDGKCLSSGFDTLIPSTTQVFEKIESWKKDNNLITFLGYSEWYALDYEKLKVYKEDLFNKTDLMFSASETVENVLKKKDKVHEELTENKIILHCSDLHSFDKGQLSFENYKCFTWIKAKPTFEGLKQVIFEPKSRVYIGVDKPIEPIHKIKNISLDFSEDYVWDNEKFCFSGKNSINFNPYLTSIIGGRGTGKSTLLNLIGKKLGFKSEFFDKFIINDENLIINPIAINNIEFLPQNEIDRFAKDSHAFTLAIFTRIDKLSNNILSKFENDNIENLNKFNSQIYKIKELENLKREQESEDKKLSINKNIISTFQDKVYLDNKKELDKCVKEINEITNSRESYKNLYENLKKLSEDFLLIEEKNEYDKYFNELKTDLDNTYNKFKNKNYDEIKLKLKNLDDEKNKYNQNIESFLIEKGFNNENIKDLSIASENIVSIENRIMNLTSKISILDDEINIFSYEDKNIEYKNLVDDELKKINSTFKEIQEKNPDDVKLIQINYKFNNNINEQVFNKLVNELEINTKISSIRSTFFEYLFKVSTEQVLEFQTYEELKEKLTLEIKQTNTKTFALLDEIMFNEMSFKIYKFIIQQTKQDFAKNKILEVLYDDKTLDKASFGQRCTSAIVILISLGNNPIIIDEPEAHLDSSLIANYLVELIKEKKKQRQIIFATHNANFVLNADSELIIKLDNIDGKTVCTSFSIEDLEHRDSLLKLEGGIEAFKKRERKYNIN